MLTVEKIEDSVVTIDDGEARFNVDISLFDGTVRETDVVNRLENGRYKTDRAMTEKRKKEILNLQNSLWE